MLPELDAPDRMPPDLEAAVFPPVAKSRSSRQTLTPSEMLEAASTLSQHTIEEIMCIVMKGQIELEKENALVAENTLEKYQHIKKLREGVLDEIKDALAKDEKFLQYCKNAQNVAALAAFFCGIATAAVSFGVLAPLGAGAAFSVVSALATYGPVVTACFMGVTTGSKAYSQRRLNEDMAQHEQFNHQDKYTGDRIEDARERLMAAAEADQVFKERLILHAKRLSKMIQLVMKK